MKALKFLFVVALSAGALSACSETKEQLGLTKTVPDEFTVVKRAPLAMPPEYSLRPPRAGAPRPQEQATSEEARTAVFGEEEQRQSAEPTSAEEALLQQAGGNQADPEIREKLAEENESSSSKDEPIGTKLLGIGGDSDDDAETVDAAEEAERLREMKAEQDAADAE